MSGAASSGTIEGMTRVRRSQVATAALLGMVSVAGGVAVAELASGALRQRVSPLVAVAEQVIALTPGPVVETAISVVGSYDKPLLVALTLAAVLGLGALVGVVAMRSLLSAQALFLALGAVVLWAVHARVAGSTSTYLPAIAGLVASLALLAVLRPRAAAAAAARKGLATEPQTADEGGPVDERSRRQFLTLTGAVALSSLVVGAAGRYLAGSRAAVENARRRLNLPVRPAPTPTGTEQEADGIAPWVTSQRDFYRIDTTLSVPQVVPEEWQLRVHGEVDRELTLSYQDLLDRGLEDAWVTLCCVSNQVGGDLIGNARWSGVRLADVLAEAGVAAGADAVKSTSADGWTCGTPLVALTDDRNALLAVAMNGEPLTPEHGFPVRMVVPGLYGYVSATKWVVDLEVTRFDNFSAFWTERGWSAQGPIKTQSRIDVPADGADLPAGNVVIGGVAWAQHTGIAGVEVRVDDGSWMTASLAAQPSIDSWVQWSVPWQASPGSHDIAVRATDRSGYTQTADIADVVPDGATGWHTVTVTVKGSG